MERSGNAVVNSMFEATLAAECFEKDVVLNNMNEEDDRRGEFVSRKYIKSEFVNTPFPKARGATVLVNGKDQGSHTGEDAHLASKNSRSIWKRPLNRQSLPARKQSQGNLDVKSVRAHRGKSYSGPVNALKPKNSSSSSSSSSSSKATWNNPTSCRNRMAIHQGKQSTNKASSHTSSPPQLGRRLSFSTSRLLQTSQIQSAVSRISTFSVVGKRQSRHAASTIRSVTSSSKERPDVRGSSRSSWNSQRAVLASF